MRRNPPPPPFFLLKYFLPLSGGVEGGEVDPLGRVATLVEGSGLHLISWTIVPGNSTE